MVLRRNRICIVGHSHLRALTAAGREVPHFEFLNLHQASLYRGQSAAAARRVDGRAVLREEVAEAITMLRDGGCTNFALQVGGAGHSMIGLARHVSPFDCRFPWDRQEENLDVSAYRIPFRTLRATIDQLNVYFFTVLEALLVELKDTPCVVLEAPPPVELDELLLKQPGSYAEPLARYGLQSARLRYGIWRTQAELFEAIAARYGRRYLRAPPETLQTSGHLRAEFFSDPTHGNAAYGRAVLAQLDHSFEPEYH